MMKEIHEQPKAVADTFHSVLKDGRINLEEMGLTEEAIKEISQIVIVACGSAYHVGMVTQYVMEIWHGYRFGWNCIGIPLPQTDSDEGYAGDRSQPVW